MTDHCGETSTSTSTSPMASPTLPPVTTTASPTSKITTAITFSWAPILFRSPWELKVLYHWQTLPNQLRPISGICACCTNHQCSYNPNHCAETTAPVAVPTTTPAVTITTSPTVHQFYPVGGGNVITCISKHPYPASISRQCGTLLRYMSVLQGTCCTINSGITVMKQHQNQCPPCQLVLILQNCHQCILEDSISIKNTHA